MRALFQPLPASSGFSVTDYTAMLVSTIYACLSKISGAWTQLPLHHYRMLDGAGARQSMEQTPIWWLLNESPSDRWTAAGWREWIVRCVHLRGDQITEIIRKQGASAGGAVESLLPYHPDNAKARRHPTIPGRNVYDLTDADTGKTHTVDQDDVLHFSGFGFDGLKSLSVVQHAARNSIGNALAASDFVGRQLGEGAMPKIALEYQNKLNPDQAALLRQSFVATYSGAGSQKLPLILTEGGKATPLTWNAVDMELIATQRFQREDMCQACGVPPVLIGENEKTSSWGTGIEQIMLGFVKLTPQAPPHSLVAGDESQALPACRPVRRARPRCAARRRQQGAGRSIPPGARRPGQRLRSHEHQRSAQGQEPAAPRRRRVREAIHRQGRYRRARCDPAPEGARSMKVNQLLQLLRDNARNQADVAAAPAIRSESTDTEAHIYVYDVIDSFWGASAKSLIQALASAGDKAVHLHINSPGGDVFESLAMAAAIVAHPTPIAAHVEGVAASAATSLALACATCDILEGSLFMVHNSWTLAMGDKTDLRATAALLEKVDAGIVGTYCRATGCTADEAIAWMEAETWFTAAETVDAGFAAAVTPASQRAPAEAAQASAARWNLSAYAHAPKLEPVEDPAIAAAELAAATTRTLQANRARLKSLHTH